MSLTAARLIDRSDYLKDISPAGVRPINYVAQNTNNR